MRNDTRTHYGDLFEVIGRDVPDFTTATYRTWETEIVTPILEQKGYTVHSWKDGERDSFGPLSRIVAVTTPDGTPEQLIYG